MGSRMRISWFLAIMGLAGLVGAAYAQAPPPYTPPPPRTAAAIIVPGYSIGMVTLDAQRSDLYWILGVPVTSRASSSPGPQFRTDLRAEYWNAPPLTAVFHPALNAIEALGTPTKDFATREKISVGARADAVTATYGGPSAVIQFPSRPKVLIYDKQGIAFNIAWDAVSGNYGAVEGIYVFRPGTASTIWRTP